MARLGYRRALVNAWYHGHICRICLCSPKRDIDSMQPNWLSCMLRCVDSRNNVKMFTCPPHLSVSTLLQRAANFLTSRHYQKLLGLVYKRTAFWKFLAIESTISSVPLRPTGRSGRSQGGANQVRIICGLRPAASANKILATLEPEPQSNEILVLKTAPKPIAECLAAIFRRAFLINLTVQVPVDKQETNILLIQRPRQCKVNFNTRNGALMHLNASVYIRLMEHAAGR